MFTFPGGNDTFVEGDMFVERNVRSTHTYGIPAASVGKWPGGVVPYIIAGNIGMYIGFRYFGIFRDFKHSIGCHFHYTIFL